MILLTIIIICFILYKSGAVGGFLKSCKVQEEPTQEPEPLEPEEGRQKWENEARYILTMQGQINPDTVKYMGDEMLIKIIRDYLDI